MQHSTILWIIVIIAVLVILWIWYTSNTSNTSNISWNEPFVQSNSMSKSHLIANDNNDNNDNKYDINNFVYNEPKEQYHELISQFGYPDIVRNKPNGAAIWLNKDIFDKIILADELIKDSSPVPHDDFINAVVNVHIPENSMCDVLTLDDSIIYDQLKNELTVRADSMISNIAILLTIMRTIDRDDARVTIPSNDYYYHILYDELKSRIHANQEKYNLNKNDHV